MVKIAIVEDDISCRELLQEYLEKYSREKNLKIKVSCFSDGDEIASDYNPAYDIIFLDIDMKRFDGLNTAKYIREYDKDVIIIFVTNMAQYAIKGYSVNALDFLLKPVPYFVFSQQLDRSIKLIKSKRINHIFIPIDNGIVKIATNTILFIESMKHVMKIHTLDKVYNIMCTMKELEKKLEEDTFFRSNHCYLVNLAHISAVKGDYVIIGNHELKISRPKKKLFLDALTAYIGGLR